MLRLFQFTEDVKCRPIFQKLISWGPYSSLERKRKICRRLFTSSIKRAIQKGIFSRRSRAVTAEKRTKKRDARAKFFFANKTCCLFDVLPTDQTQPQSIQLLYIL